MSATVVQVDLPEPTLPTFLKDLAKSTSSALVVLRPWCRDDFAPPTTALSCIKLQAQSYVGAIKLSVIAAQQGHNIAEEALGFSKNVDNREFSEKDRQGYLRGMVDIARRGEDNATKANEAFRGLRRKLEALIADSKVDIAKGTDRVSNTISSLLTDLEKGTSALEDLSSCVSQYINWWTAQDMAHKSLSASSEQLVINYSSLRKRTVIQKWVELKKAYVEYTDMIKELEDLDPAFSAEMKQALRQEETQYARNPAPNLTGFRPSMSYEDVIGPAPMLYAPMLQFYKKAEENMKDKHKHERWFHWFS
ncbi:hypothetical protein D9613_002378 [Agrocybe pediades]|uniref:Uncharacterized protein n=1 Tax=Agrocybe pediades TaxID=84607 RepID=A0A8H4R5B0_9AGAR|nr:hypothetical protein D9613_002378 [Agrocybe pediades]